VPHIAGLMRALQAAEKLNAWGTKGRYGLQPVHKPRRIMWPLKPLHENDHLEIESRRDG
jgi:hypothetical protein